MADAEKDEFYKPPLDLGHTLIQAGDERAEVVARSVAPSTPPTHAPKIPGYVVLSPLGHGSFAHVWKAQQIRTGKLVALKVFTNPTGVNWLLLQREVERLIKLDKHPNVVSLLDADLTASPPWYALELLEAGSLEKHVSSAQTVSVPQVVKWMEEIAGALAYVHSKGIIHCDLKPANVLLDEQGHARVADFGQARALSDAQGALGTLFFMAPEQAVLPKDGETPQPDVRWDLYALGATMYGLLTGKLPRSESSLKELESSPTLTERLRVYREKAMLGHLNLQVKARVKADEDLVAIVEKCLEVDPAKRYGSVGAVLTDLHARQERRPVTALAKKRGYRLQRFLLRNWTACTFATVVCLLIIGSGLRIAVERRNAIRHLAATYLLRGEQYAREMNPLGAIEYYAESNALVPSPVAELNCFYYLSALPEPQGGMELKDNSGDLTSSLASPDGRKVALGFDTGAVWIVDLESRVSIIREMHRRSIIEKLAFSPDGTRLASGGGLEDETVRLWDARSGMPLGVLKHKGKIEGINFSPDGRYLVTRDTERLRVWDVQMCREVAAIPGSGQQSNPGCAFSPDGRLVIWNSGVGSVSIADWRKHKIESVIKDGVGGVISPDGKTALIWAGWHKAYLHDVASGKRMAEFSHENHISCAAFSPDGTKVLTASFDRTLKIWNSVTGVQIGLTVRLGAGVVAAQFMPDSQSILVATGDGYIRNVGLDGVVSQFGVVAYQDHAACGLSPIGERVVTLTWVGKHVIHWWGAKRRQEKGKAIDLGGIAQAVSSGSGRLLAIQDDGSIHVWNIQTGVQVGPGMNQPNSGGGSALAMSKDGRRAVIGDWSGKALIWNLDTDEQVGKPIQHAAYISGAVFSPDGKRIGTASQDGTARLWDAGNGEPICPPMVHKYAVFGLAISPDGNFLATSNDGDTILKLWNGKTGVEVGRKIDKRFPSGYVGFSPDGKWVICNNVFWNPVTNEVRTNIHGFLFGAHGDLALHPDGRHGAISDGNEFRILEYPSMAVIGRAMQHDFLVQCKAYSPNGDLILTGAWDGTARLWDGKTGAPIGDPIYCSGGVREVGFDPSGKSAYIVNWGDTNVRFLDLSWTTRTTQSRELLREAHHVTGLQIAADGTLEPLASGVSPRP